VVSASPFATGGNCPPKAKRCSGARRSPVRASRNVVRPGRRDGGTTLIFRLSKPAVLRITIVRVYPSCKRLGSFLVRAHSGVNRVRFRSRLRGRALPEGGYRLVIRARGATRDAAAVPIVVARGKITKEQIHKARSTSACSGPVAQLASASTDPSPVVARDGDNSGGGVAASIKRGVKAPCVEAAGAVSRAAKGLSDRVSGAAPDDPLNDPFVITLLGFLALASALLGGLVLAHLARVSGFRDRGSA
jgi:hypothetical protein